MTEFITVRPTRFGQKNAWHRDQIISSGYYLATMKLYQLVLATCVLAGCETKAPNAVKKQASTVGELNVGADFSTYEKVNKSAVRSQDHGRRFVDTYVNATGLEAYTDGDEAKPFPVGSIIVKTSWEAEGDAPSQIPGPTFVMKKMEPGYSSENSDWYFAMHWKKPVGSFAKQFPNGVYWESPSPQVKYCAKCHNGYDRQVGLVPEAARSW